MGKIANQPAFILQYGPPKMGKTTDGLLSFPRALWVAAPGALKPSLGVCGYEPPERLVVDAASIADATTALLKHGASNEIDACIVDDLTLMVDRTVAALKSKGVDGYDLWGAVHGQVLALRETGRRLGKHVVLNCHELPPRTDNGTRLKGSPALPGKALPYKVPAACDLVVRAMPAPDDVEFGWPIVYRCNPGDGDWISGDRHNVTPDLAPMNLGEILRLAGRVGGNPNFGPRRLAGLEWQEEIVEKVSQRVIPVLAEVAKVREILKGTVAGCESKFKASRLQAVWTIRDAYDRAVLNNAIKAHQGRLYGI